MSLMGLDTATETQVRLVWLLTLRNFATEKMKKNFFFHVLAKKYLSAA